MMWCYWFDVGHQGWIGRCAKGESLLGLSEPMAGGGDGHAGIRIHTCCRELNTTSVGQIIENQG